MLEYLNAEPAHSALTDPREQGIAQFVEGKIQDAGDTIGQDQQHWDRDNGIFRHHRPCCAQLIHGAREQDRREDVEQLGDHQCHHRRHNPQLDPRLPRWPQIGQERPDRVQPVMAGGEGIAATIGHRLRGAVRGCVRGSIWLCSCHGR